MSSYVLRMVIKLSTTFYKILHPCLWYKKIQLNGVPNITSINNLKLGTNVSINEKVNLQCVGG